MFKDLFKKHKKGPEIKDKEDERKEEAKPRTNLQGDPVSFRAVKNPRISEKITNLGVLNQYGFDIFARANKTEVKKAVEKIYNVKVAKVRVLNMPSKFRQVGRHQGHKPEFKKAIVSLKEGYKIETVK